MRIRIPKTFLTIACTAIALVLITTVVVPTAYAQATSYAGVIQGTVTDPTGAVVAGAKVTAKNQATGAVTEMTTSSSGLYSSGSLAPGQYLVKVEAKGFMTSQMMVTVSIGNISAGNFKMSIGQQTQVVEVTGTTVAINTDQPQVQGVLSTREIDTLPVAGRNFLDLAQLEPGLQIQDGGNFDPTKNGFSSISFGGRAGRTARINMDGIDISDETVGTTTENVSTGVIQEFQVSQSTLDLSSELTSSGAVNVLTKSGSNAMHGDAFYAFRDKRAGIANFPGGQNNYFQRNQFGGNLGGAIVKDKLFWFTSAERVKQATLIPIVVAAPFAAIPPGYSSPFKDTNLFGKLDYNGPKGMKFFYRIGYNWNGDIAAYGSTFQPFANRNQTPSHTLGWDWSKGNTTHSIRYGYRKFQNHIADAVLGGGVYDPAGSTPVAMRIGGANTQYRFGPSRLTPQATFQENNQLKYDGSWLKGKHIVRYGVDLNRIRGGGFASFYLFPEMRAVGTGSTDTFDQQRFADGCNPDPNSGPCVPNPVFPGGRNNPLNYRLSAISLGNGQGFATEFPSFNYPAGGQRDNRLGLYIGDSWKIKPNLTLTYGVRYSRDTGRSDSDMAPLTCDMIPAQTISDLGYNPCSSPSQRILDLFGGNYGGKVNQPNLNFGPQLGFAWSPGGSTKTVIRGGAGMYYENTIFNNVLFDRPVRLQKGLFYTQSLLCGANGTSLVLPTGTVNSFPYNGVDTPISSLCNQHIGSVMNQVVALSNYYQQQVAAGGQAANAGFVGAALTSGTAPGLIAPNYKSGQSYQMNIGIQRELHPGTVLTVDFLRNVGLHYLLGVDTNHVGDARYLNRNAAQAAIAATLAACEVGSINAAIAACPGLHPATETTPVGPATISDFANNGLGSGYDIGGGLPAVLGGVPTGYAFGGINPLVGSNPMLFPIGRSTYTALQTKLKTNLSNPVKGIARVNLQVSYALSRFNSMLGNTGNAGGDQDFVNAGTDYANPGKYYGPGSLDRTHQFAFGATFDLPKGPQISFIGHFNSPLAITPTLQNSQDTAEIFFSDLTGDGTVGDVVGTKIGSIGRDYNGSGINTLINAFNTNQAGKLTPAGQALVTSGLMTADQLIALGATIPSLSTAPADQSGLTWLKTFDLKFAYPIKIRERLTITPSVAVFNLFNMANFNTTTAPGSILSGILDGSEGSLNGTSRTSDANPRAGLGTGVNTIGSPRQMEFQLRFTF